MLVLEKLSSDVGEFDEWIVMAEGWDMSLESTSGREGADTRTEFRITVFDRLIVARSFSQERIEQHWETLKAELGKVPSNVRTEDSIIGAYSEFYDEQVACNSSMLVADPIPTLRGSPTFEFDEGEIDLHMVFDFAKASSPRDVLQFFQERFTDEVVLNVRDPRGQTLLHIATSAKSIPCIRHLIEKGESVTESRERTKFGLLMFQGST
jgi:hypothetical protein